MKMNNDIGKGSKIRQRSFQTLLLFIAGDISMHAK